MAQIAPSPAAIAREHTHTNTNERNAFASLPSISITSADSDTHLPLHTPTSTSASTSTHTYTHTRPVTQYDPYIPSDTETSDPIIPSRESSPTTSRGSQSTSRPPGQVTDGDDIGGKGDGSVKTIRAKKRASFPDLIQAASASAPSIVKVDQAGSATAKGGTAEMPVPPASSRLSTDTIRSEDSDTHRRPSMEEILPVGMDMRGALAKCEDPRLGWSLQFWITIVDPVVRPLHLSNYHVQEKLLGLYAERPIRQCCMKMSLKNRLDTHSMHAPPRAKPAGHPQQASLSSPDK